MSEFFLELFSEEIPANLQSSARKELKDIFIKFCELNQINIRGKIKSFSTPNRLVIFIDKISEEVEKKSIEIRGPNVNAPDIAIQGFLKSNNINQNQIYKKTNEKGEFFFFNKPSEKISVFKLFRDNIESLVTKIPWKKSMKWGDYSLYWGRPLKSILAVFDKKVLNFKIDHLQSSNKTFLDKDLEENIKIFNDFKKYEKFFKKNDILIDQETRKNLIRKEITKAEKKYKFHVNINENLLDEVTNLVEKPKVLVGQFDKKFLNIPKEILITTMQTHQKYFPTLDNKNNIINSFIVVADISDSKGLVKIGNERVIDARLSDAEFFWNKNKSQNLVKQVTKLKNVNYFKGLGTYFDKVQRMRKLSGLISDEFMISKEKIEIASTICKVDLMSDLVGEFPELQGVMGGYFAETQGFEKDVSLAVAEHYYPIGMDSKLPKKIYSIALSLSDKIDSLVGFFGINLKPSSSKDPYAIRRTAISVVRLIIENNLKVKLRELINYSCMFYKEQGFEFDLKKLNLELGDFLYERVKNYLKEKQIRNDIIESASHNFSIDELLKVYKKTYVLNKSINKDFGKDVVAIYKRSASILLSENKNLSNFNGNVDPGLFKNDYEKNLYKKIHEIKKYYSSVGRDENFEESLKILSFCKSEVFDFFENVIVNDSDETIKNNRLELLSMLCKSFDNYFNFSKIEG